MDQARARELLDRVAAGDLLPAEAAAELRRLPYRDIGFARIDHHRALRDALPEVILAEGKTPEQVVAAAREILDGADRLLVTRAVPEAAQALAAAIPDVRAHPPSTALSVDRRNGPPPPLPGILALSGGSADLPVLEEAAATAELMGHAVDRIVDVGVAGLHRVLDQLDALQAARVLIVVAGMDAALPSVVAGLTAAPVIAVPTSTGYGAAFEGLAALLATLNACAPGVTVVNIDNGFGAGYQAALVNRLAATAPD
jgi:NCAIR mutase (PurE)-related protein